MSITTSSVQELFPEFASVDDDLVQSYIDIAIQYVSLSFWGEDKFDYIHSLMTAHLMKLSGADGSSSAAGAVSSERLGDIAVSYAVDSVDMSDLASTKYGAQIKTLRAFKIRSPISYA